MANNEPLSEGMAAHNVREIIKTPLDKGLTYIYSILFGLLAILLVFHVGVHIAHLGFGKPIYAITQLFDMDNEGNIPAFFNSMLFVAGAFLFYLIWLTQPKPRAKQWMIMALIFLFLAVDETSSIHEKLMIPMLRLMNGGEMAELGEMGWLFYAWIIPYGVAAIFLGATLLPWLLKLDRKVSLGLILSGVVYLAGAIFMESWSGKIADGLQATAASDSDLPWLPCEVYVTGGCYLYNDIRYIALYTIEEVLEMTGLILCIGVLFKVLKARKIQVEVDVVD